ncbi:MAG: hypothetical protein KatS3mg008_1138 [Acidimicrobiales bacterium]|nr:MAG: hypothetical protein KatS3mg008_1138 [Acidimicrobiales bacterium]
MRLERLVLDAGELRLGIDFHPRLTVIGPLEKAEREAFTDELLTAMGRGRPGLHVEVTDVSGRRLAVFRPRGGLPMVVDVDTAKDVTTEFVDRSGHVDLIGSRGVEASRARGVLRVTEADVEREDIIERLARIDQGRLWELADKVLERQAELERASEAVGASRWDAALVRELEQRHQSLERQTEVAERKRVRAFGLSVATLLASGFLAVLVNPLVLVPLVSLSIAAWWKSLQAFHKVESLEREEAALLERLGVDSYLTFQIKRANGLIEDDTARARLIMAIESHNAALDEWRVLAGDVDVEWAVANRKEIRAAARSLGQRIGVGRVVAHRSVSENPRLAARNVAARAEEAARSCAGADGVDALGEGFPVVLDEPFGSLDRDGLGEAFAELLSVPGDAQLILLTGRSDLVELARRACASGEDLAVMSPAQQMEVVDDSVQRGEPARAAS